VPFSSVIGRERKQGIWGVFSKIPKEKKREKESKKKN